MNCFLEPSLESEQNPEVPRYDQLIRLLNSVREAAKPQEGVGWVTPSSSLEGIGRKSLLTPEVVSSAAASEIQTGRRVGLGWDVAKLEFSQFGRQKCVHELIPLMGPGGSGYGACLL
ncbi:uncharacterized protein L3040_005554 [Drepanopeziza brunnea f. sp. 'multigermtubi']|uniref:uncharacterized protein n=1 Tax=Drepanopeziza brunnea f. sp. 'multigermtubi' TaxID=698441 RepID=UPI0023A55251|nr:hypothetical protein L3040_005554 [Drepanopeziza brunnea f. sp. 'multigermtubi']